MLFSRTEEAGIVAAIRAAELETSGEIRLYVEDFCLAEHPVERAAEVFHVLGMQKTAARNGVLIYLAEKSRHFAIWGDSGIHQIVGMSFWDAEKRILREHFQKDAMAEGLCAVINSIGARLKEYFPADSDNNENELPDEIVYG